MSNIKDRETITELPEKAKTRLKFYKSDTNGSYVSFVSINRVSGCVNGVRSDSPYPKVICLLDKKLAYEILPNVLYEVELTLTAKRNAYIVTSAVPREFTAKIITSYVPKIEYRIDVKFGNKTITFDPMNGIKQSVRKFSVCRAMLEKRVDIRNLMRVLEDFDAQANALLNRMIADGFASKIYR